MITQESLPESPFVKANIISRLFFWWLNSLFLKGNKRDLEIGDLYQTLPNDKSKKLGDRLQKEWDHELSKAKASKNGDGDHDQNQSESKSAKKRKSSSKPSLLKAIIRQFGWYFMGVGILAMIEECFTRIAQPIFLGYLVRYFTGEFSERDGYLFAMGVVLSSAFYTFTHHPYFFGVQHVGMKIRVACCSLVYRKALRLSQSALGKTNVGQLTNLLSNDVNRFDQSTIYLHYLWIGPLQTIISTYILWEYYGPACLAGLAVLVLFVPFQGYTGKIFSKLRTITAPRTDKRIRILSEIVSGMRVIKMYTWEKPFAALVEDSRKNEVKSIRKTSRLRAINMSLFYFSSKLIIFLTLLVHVLTGNKLKAEEVFVTLSLYNNVRLVMTLWFPNGVSQFAETLVSIKRLQQFLLMEERSPNLSQKIITGNSLIPKEKEEINQNQNRVNTDVSPQQEIGIFVNNLSAKWTPEYTENTLSNISLSVKKGEILAVIGHVGCGKGSLLNAILQELPANQGTVSVNGTIAYASQEPWVFAGSVQQNILFGKALDPEWYETVVSACSLTRDLELLPYGDKTLVGDRGASLSGGQKARITLARTVYANADVYLLDDPLSAVDAEVGKHLFEKCICGILQNKARILVTHQLQFLKTVDKILLLDEGRVKVQGTYTDLLSSGVDFAKLLSSAEEENGEGSTVTAGGGSMKRFESFGGRARTLSNASQVSLDSIHRRESLIPAAEEEEEEGNDSPPSKEGPVALSEQTKTGEVPWSLYWKYFTSGSGYFGLVILVIMNILCQFLFSGADWWLNFWTKTQEEGYKAPVEEGDALYGLYTDQNIQVYTYSGIVLGILLFSLGRTVLFFGICMNASINLHNLMFRGIIRAPIRFFELNPIGRILNRMAKDIGNIDDLLPPTAFDVVEIFLNCAGILVIVGMVNPILLAPAGVLLVIFYFLRRFYLKTARSVKRLEGVARSPVFSHLSTSLYGLTTIRAFRAQQEFCKQFDDHQDMHTSSWYLFMATTRWFGIWLDWLSVIFIAVVTFSFMGLAKEGEGGEVGLAVSSAMMLTGMFQWGVRQSAEVANQMVSVERVLEYTKIEPEPPLESSEDRKPPKDWPKKGEIVMKDVKLSYGEDAPVLKDISCTFASQEKIGIVGRTGAGKSSLITALFRIADPSGGVIEIDGVNVLQIGLHDLRSKISIIPQDPILFSGSIRKNLDPFDNYKDEEIWRVLEDVHLAHEVKQSVAGLELEVAEGGSNFSVGQRQLVCLGRAILRKNKMLVLDEATANLDNETDALIQKTIRTKFLKCTVITVAHRLHTVMDSDKILFLDAGSVKEYDEPFTLLQDKSSSLYSLVKQTGPSTANLLYNIAKQAHINRNRVSALPETEEVIQLGVMQME